MTKAQEQERTEAIAKLREWLTPGDTVYTILRHVSRSGMQRAISPLVVRMDDAGVTDLSFWVARAVRLRVDQKNYGVKIGGCGMDMGFHLVYELSARLFPDGFGCVGAGCPSNDHSNGDRDYTPHMEVKPGTRCGEDPCTCHDPTAWDDPNAYRNGCDCGCRRVPHWHESGGYALKQRWL